MGRRQEHAPHPCPRRCPADPRRRFCGEGGGRHVDLRQLPHCPGQRHPGDEHRPGLAGSGAVELGAVCGLFGGDRLGRGAGDDQQPLRRHLRGQSVDPGDQLCRDRLYPAHPRGRAQMSGRDGGDPDRYLGRHRADACGGCRAGRPGLHPGARRRGRTDRAGSLRRRHGPALSGGQPLPGRPVQTLYLQALHRRAAGLGSGGPRCDLRRRSGQFQLPPLRHRCGLHPPVRE